MNRGYATLEEAYDTESPSSDTETESSGKRTLVVGESRSPSILSDSSSAFSSLSVDDYQIDRPSGGETHGRRPPTEVPRHLIDSPSPSRSPSPPGPSSSTSSSGQENREVMRQILRIQKDIKKLMNEEPDTPEEDFPVIETALFISVGLFILVAMNMMLRMGKQHVTYRFSAD